MTNLSFTPYESIDENIHFPPRFHFSENSLWLYLQRAQHNLSCKFKAFPINKETNVKLTNKGVPFLLKKMLEIDLIFTIKSFFSRKKYFDSILIVSKF